MTYNSSMGIFFANCGMKYFLTGSVLLYLCILPIFLSVVHEGLQRWWAWWSRSVSTAMSAMELFTYHMVALELMGMLGIFLYLCLLYMGQDQRAFAIVYFLTLFSISPILIYILTCVDCYVAVLHPITYLHLRSRSGVMLRNSAVATVWLLGVVLGYFRILAFQSNLMYISILAFAVLVVSFCCIAVLRALVRPKPGDGGQTGEPVDQMKRRAFYSMMAIVAALLMRLSINLGTEMLRATQGDASTWTHTVCLTTMTAVLFHLPSSLILPLLFLQKARKFPFDKTARKFPCCNMMTTMANDGQTKHSKMSKK